MPDSLALSGRAAPDPRVSIPAVRVSTLGVLTGLTVVLVLAPAPALAYIDPGTGSFLFQAIAAAVIGGAFAVRQFWGRIREAFQRLFGPRRAG